MGASLVENLRFILWVAVVALLWSGYQAWQLDYAPAPAATSATAQQQPAVAQPPASSLPAMPGDQTAAAAPGAPPAVPPEPAAVQGQIIHVRTDVFDVEIDTLGGDLRSVKLPVYPVHKDQPDIPVQLLDPAPDRLFAIHTGLRSGAGAPEASHLVLMQAGRSDYQLAAGADELAVTLTWEAPGQVQVTKTYHFHRGSYDIGLDYTVRNLGTEPYSVASYLQVQRLNNPPARSYFNVDSYSFTGPVAYNGSKYTKLDVKEMAAAPFTQQLAGGWIASIQHHFLAAAVPPAAQVYSYDGTVSNNIYTLNAIGPATVVAPGGQAELNAQLFVGPKLQAQLEQVANGLKLTVDYGRLTLLAQPLFWLLEQIHRLVGNWGWSIILATLLIKAAFYKLTETSGRSMARMRKLQPRMQAIQERYKDDRQKQSEALMELYKREKVNPAAGCLPMLIQIPFFIAYYWVLLESVEMRQAPFMLWITDLSTRDPYFILPLLMAAVMFLQGQLNPAPPDRTQALVMKWMPVMFAGMFAFFPAGLVLYWLTNSVLSVAQQWRINKAIAAD
ncbi:MAG: membrane protein insertase YidC [Gammaproteobacteria bacterium]|nr:membrane protein insertase YidC [Gammaproteobacteria bacterium]